MSKYLSALLGVNEQQLARTIQKLEIATLHKSTDIRLAAEIRSETKHKIAELGLDPEDTTAKELYAMLRAKVRQDNDAIMVVIGLHKEHDSVAMLHNLAAYFAKSTATNEVWSLKRTVLRKLLTAHVPSKTMKALRYRSAASMFKRESAASIYATALLVEGKTYKEKLIADMKKLGPQDFEIHKTEIISFAPEKWELIHSLLKKNIIPVYALPEVNAVVVAPIKTSHTSGLALLAAALVVTELHKVRAHASYLKMRSLSKDLSSSLQDLAQHSTIRVTTTKGIEVTWLHVHKLLAHNNSLWDAIGPHLTDEDIKWYSVESVLSGMSEQLEFWVGSHRLGFVSQQHVVPLHVIDVAMSELYDLPIEQVSMRCMRESVADELLMRYLVLPPLSKSIEQYIQNSTDVEENILYDEA